MFNGGYFFIFTYPLSLPIWLIDTLYYILMTNNNVQLSRLWGEGIRFFFFSTAQVFAIMHFTILVPYTC